MCSLYLLMIHIVCLLAHDFQCKLYNAFITFIEQRIKLIFPLLLLLGGWWCCSNAIAVIMNVKHWCTIWNNSIIHKIIWYDISMWIVRRCCSFLCCCCCYRRPHRWPIEFVYFFFGTIWFHMNSNVIYHSFICINAWSDVNFIHWWWCIQKFGFFSLNLSLSLAFHWLNCANDGYLDQSIIYISHTKIITMAEKYCEPSSLIGKDKSENKFAYKLQIVRTYVYINVRYLCI